MYTDEYANIDYSASKTMPLKKPIAVQKLKPMHPIGNGHN
jgi:hypothetical protein